MISAGYIGGGETAVVGQPITAAQAAILNDPPPAPAAPIFGGEADGVKVQMPAPADTGSMPPMSAEQAAASRTADVNLKDSLALALKPKSPWPGIIGNTLDKLIQFGGGVWAQSIAWTHAENMENRKYDTADRISDNNVSMNEKLLDTVAKLEPQRIASEERKRQIDGNTTIEVNNRLATMRERQTAMGRLEENFSLGSSRRDYGYGNPFAANG